MLDREHLWAVIFMCVFYVFHKSIQAVSERRDFLCFLLGVIMNPMQMLSRIIHWTLAQISAGHPPTQGIDTFVTSLARDWEKTLESSFVESMQSYDFKPLNDLFIWFYYKSFWHEKPEGCVLYICQYCGNTIHDFTGTLNGYFLGNGVIYVRKLLF